MASLWDSPARTIHASRLDALGSFVFRIVVFFSTFGKLLSKARNQVLSSLKTRAERRKESAADMAQTNCIGLIQQAFCHTVFLCLVLAFISIPITLGASTVFNTDGVCLPNGDFALYQGTYNPWAPSGFFQITLGFGALPFSKVKVIDIAWDVVSDRRLRFESELRCLQSTGCWPRRPSSARLYIIPDLYKGTPPPDGDYAGLVWHL